MAAPTLNKLSNFSARIILLTVFLLPFTISFIRGIDSDAIKSLLINLSISLALILTVLSLFLPTQDKDPRVVANTYNPIVVILVILLDITLILSLFFSQSRGTSLSSYGFLNLITLPFLFLVIGLNQDPDFTVKLKKIIKVCGFLAGLINLIFIGRGGLIGSPFESSTFFIIVVIFLLADPPLKVSGLKIRLNSGFGLINLILALINILLVNPFRYRPIALDFKTSLEVMLGVLRDFPLFGIGPGLFGTAFYLYKPLNFNLSPYAFEKFIRGPNFFLTFISEYGLVPALSFLLLLLITFIKSFLGLIRGIKKREPCINCAGLSFIILFALSFTGNISPTLIFFLFLFSALILSSPGGSVTNNFSPLTSRGNNSKRKTLTGIFVLMMITLTPLFITILSLLNFTAQYFYDRYQDPVRSVKFNPRLDLYHAALSENYLKEVKSINEKGSTGPGSRKLVEKLIRDSLFEIKTALKLNPLSFENFYKAGAAYRSLIGSVKGAKETAKSLLTHAIKLNPYDPRIRVALAALNRETGLYNEAVNNLKEALFLKSDYLTARLSLARILKEMGKKNEAAEAYRSALALFDDKNSEDYSIILKEIEDLDQ